MAEIENVAALTKVYQPITPFPKETPLAMAYVPFQSFGKLYDETLGLDTGTMFPDLDKPFTGKRDTWHE